MDFLDNHTSILYILMIFGMVYAFFMILTLKGKVQHLQNERNDLMHQNRVLREELKYSHLGYEQAVRRMSEHIVSTKKIDSDFEDEIYDEIYQRIYYEVFDQARDDAYWQIKKEQEEQSLLEQESEK